MEKLWYVVNTYSGHEVKVKEKLEGEKKILIKDKEKLEKAEKDILKEKEKFEGENKDLLSKNREYERNEITLKKNIDTLNEEKKVLIPLGSPDISIFL